MYSSQTPCTSTALRALRAIIPFGSIRPRQTAALLIAIGGFAISGQAAELVPNGGFETAAAGPWLTRLAPNLREFYAGAADAPFANWAFGGRWERGDYSIASSDQAHTGQRSCQITCLKKGRGGIACPPMQLKPGDAIQVSCWLKAREASGGRVFLNFEGTPGDGWTSKDLKTGTYDWTRFTKRAVVPASKAGGPQTIVVFLYTTCEGAIWVDDFSIQPADASDDPEAKPKLPKPIPEPANSIGYRVNVVSPLEKVFREDDFSAATRSGVALAAARNEYESMQVVVEAPWRPVTISQVQISDLQGPGGAIIPASSAKWDRVEYIETTVTPPYFAERGLGSYPDPLMPAGPFTVAKLSRTPVWITLKTPMDCPPGQYTGTITVIPEILKPTTIAVTLTVWDFVLTDQTHLRTLTWLGGGVLREWYGHDWSAQGERKQAETVRNYEDCLLEHRLGPGGEVAAHVQPGKDGQFDFRGVDATLQRLLDKGMNAFIMGTAPNLAREKKTEYTPQFVQQFTNMLKAYGDHLRQKGWLDRAYVYVYDEAPKAAWPEVKRIDLAIHAAAPQARILQCLNEPEGVRELTGFADVFDVYIAQYHKAGVAQSQTKGAEVWLALCCYPMEHPNFFLEYPLLDVRVTPWICWKYQANGFEYWSPNAWGANWQKKGDKWPKVPWVANTFGKYNGDGYLVYPGADLKPYSSLRFEALRDGLEDYEYLWMLNSLLPLAAKRNTAGPEVDNARRLLALDEMVKATGSYSPQTGDYLAHRRKLAEAIVALKKLVQ
jgi:hypothetical protein